MIRVLILCLTAASVLADSETVAKTAKTPTSSQPSIQPASQKVTPPNDDPLLNSINAYAQQLETAAPAKQQFTSGLYSQPYTSVTNYNNSPQLPSSPTIETNFQPIPAPHHHQPHIQPHQLHQNHPTPVIMQYLPQSPINDGVQYLQLIPTRPLIVPISPYVSPMTHQYQGPQLAATPPRAEFTPAGRALLAADSGPPSNIPYGLQSYANSLQNYRSYRFNREIRPNNVPSDFSLNLNRMPSPNDAPKPPMLIRGRP